MPESRPVNLFPFLAETHGLYAIIAVHEMDGGGNDGIGG